MNRFNHPYLENIRLSYNSLSKYTCNFEEDLKRNICIGNTQQEIGLRNAQRQADKCAPCITNSAPGGIDLKEKLKVVNVRGVELFVQSVKIIPSRRCVQVNTSAGNFTYTPSIITADELTCLESAVRQTTKGSLMFSMEDGCFVTDGIVATLPAAELVSRTINEADHLLASLTYGVDHSTWEKTKAPVSSYFNPLHVRCKLLEAIGIDAQSTGTWLLKSKNWSKLAPHHWLSKPEAIVAQAYNIYSKFSNVRPWPTIVMDTAAVAVASDGCIRLQGPLLKVDMRGLYTDWLGNQYFDDKAECCIEQEPFLIDFRRHHSKYIQRYSVLSRLEEYAIVIGLCLADPYKSVGTKETHKAVPSNSNSDIGDDVNTIIQRAIAATECLIEREKDLITRVFMSIHLAQSLLEYNAKRAKDWSLLAILYLDNQSSTSAPAVLVKHLSSKAHLILAHSLGIGSLPAEKKNIILTDEDTAELEQLLYESELEHGNGDRPDKLEQLLGSLKIEHASSDQSRLQHRYGLRAIETSLQQALAAEDWSTASAAAKLIMVDFCFSAGLSEAPSNIIVANQWLQFETERYGGLIFPPDQRPLLSVLNSMWPDESAGEVECTNEALLSKFRTIFPSADSITAPNAEAQLSGFVHYLHAGICLQKKDTMPDALQQALTSSLHAICNFCKPCAAASLVNWHVLIAATASRLAECCEAFMVNEEVHSFKQRLEDTSKELNDMLQSRSTVHLKNILQNIHQLRQFAQKCQFHELLAHTAEMMLTAYTISGDKEKALIWKRVFEVDSKNAKK